MELAGAKISLRAAQDHCLRTRDDRHRSWYRYKQRRLLAGDVRAQYQPLSNRVAYEFGSSARSRCIGGCDLPETQGWLGFSRESICGSAVISSARYRSIISVTSVKLVRPPVDQKSLQERR